ncbi:Uncharacterized protein TCAP_04793 [Tolypocladium capitatum]|uniref:Glycosyl transferase CAP10 domain-containing protein n=1 Tax=Tolypocladium capitatum TaxID=45235 RepID=A0A2K3QCM1_9HYPO|nr:Uncharacterized protein TCAP_04793 [Tolypocladium capitatum]
MKYIFPRLRLSGASSPSRHLGWMLPPAGAALLCAAIAQHLAARDVEFASEAICWALLPALTKATRWRDGWGRGAGSTAPALSWPLASRNSLAFALGVVAACWYRAEQHIVVLHPALTPLLLVSGARLAPAVATDSRPLGPSLTTTRWGSGLVAAFSCIVLVRANGTDLLSLGVCLLVVALLYAGYRAVSPTPAEDGGSAEEVEERNRYGDAVEVIDAHDVALPCALRVLPILAAAMGVRTFFLHESNGTLVPAVVVGLVKALAWLFTLETTQQSSWCVATTIGTFAMTSTRNPFSQTSDLQAASNLGASILSLGQTIDMLPRAAAKTTRLLWVLCLLPLVPFLANMYAIHALTMSLPQGNHPVEALARAAEAEFDAMLARQSQNYTAAEAEYRRRYGIGPPVGFEAWYDFAVARGSPIIDEFDVIHDGIAPFLGLSGRRVREAMREASHADMWTCAFDSETGQVRCKHPWRSYDRHYAASFGMLGDLKGLLPDMEFIVNHLDEPRVMLPDKESMRHGPVTMTDLSWRPVWDTLTRNCPQGVSSSSASRGGAGVDTHGMPFVTDTRADKDLCRHPEYRNMHGLALSPMSFKLVDGPAPVLSTGAPSTMGDLLFPSPAYGLHNFVYDEDGDVPWERKRNNLYWAGSTTGGYAADEDEWRRFHRHRFVGLAQGLEDRGKRWQQQQHWYLREGPDGVVRRTASSFLNRRLWDVAFTNVVQCLGAACDAQRRHLHMRPWADKDAALRSTLVFDTDGNGISGRFGKLLASRSALLKQTLLREWHDDRLVPWVHYAPVSQGMAELPELVAWLTETEAGRARARRLAEAGREWAARAMRVEDRGVYVYRLMLELARALDPEREAM